MDEDAPKKKANFEIGQNLEELSVEELNDTIVVLKEEIMRIEAASDAKSKHLSAADALFAKF